MTYEKLGLMCGVEIHQQLEGKKLFCSCPTIITDDNSSDFEVRRYLRASRGETGKIDVAAKQEQAKNKLFIYNGKLESSCIVETDSEPPHPIDKDALYASLQFSKIVGADISPIIQVMRKTVVDGSNTSGFQRTALVARNGVLESSEGKVRITNISIEEDSCRTLDESPENKTYHLDRLGIPLIEIGTAPDIKSPKQCQEIAKMLGSFLRSLPNCKRGLGTIRQDVNVSIKGGNRIEVKGAQDLKQIPLLVELEVKRQDELLKIKDELETKKIKLNELEIVDFTEILKKSQSKVIVSTLKKKGKILGIKINGFKGLIGRELQPNYRVGSELAGRARRKAGVGGIFHSDELPNYGITSEEVALILDHINSGDDDAFILVSDKEERARQALVAVHERLSELYTGVPKEVRKAWPDGTTRFLRPIPGASRMYPETDVPLIVTKEIGEITLPELLDEKIDRFVKDYSLAKDLATFVVKSDFSDLFEELVSLYKDIKSAFIAETIGPTLLEIKRKYGVDISNLDSDNFKDLFKYLSEDKIHKDIVIDVLQDMAKGTFDLKNYESLGTEEIHKEIVSIVNKNKKAPFPALMGMCMKQLAGKASGKFISQELKKIIEEGHK
jgi:glutamyl-tRNA(Gln) amidotransferase subunit E